MRREPDVQSLQYRSQQNTVKHNMLSVLRIVERAGEGRAHLALLCSADTAFFTNGK